ncbi:MAG: EFR1 family ferrodoxin [Lawsonibacter sp.]|jgi:NAD-dependent dihydropyrimidine dehydrogenase PreA subunit
MEVKHVWAVYFSGTGTTQKVVTTLSKSIAQGLGADWQEYCFNLPKAREQELSFTPEDLVVLGVPVYAGRVPNLLLPYVRDMVHGNGALAVPVVLYGNRNFDDGLMELRNVARDNGFHPISAGAFVGEHSFSRILGAGRPDEQDMQLVQTLADRTVQMVKTLDHIPEQPVAVEGCDPIRPYYTPRDRHGEPIKDFLKAKPVTDPTKCVKCGLCAQLCPMGSIDPNDVSNVSGKCIKCCACVKKCPTGAKYFDHEGYLYHQHELEEQYAGRRADSKIFFE